MHATSRAAKALKESEAENATVVHRNDCITEEEIRSLQQTPPGLRRGRVLIAGGRA